MESNGTTSITITQPAASGIIFLTSSVVSITMMGVNNTTISDAVITAAKIKIVSNIFYLLYLNQKIFLSLLKPIITRTIMTATTERIIIVVKDISYPIN
jgi:hypothetical protein